MVGADDADLDIGCISDQEDEVAEKEDGELTEEDEEKEDGEISNDEEGGAVDNEDDDQLVITDPLLSLIIQQPDDVIRNIHSFIHDRFGVFTLFLTSCSHCRVMRRVFEPSIYNHIIAFIHSWYGNSDVLYERYVCGRRCMGEIHDKNKRNNIFRF